MRVGTRSLAWTRTEPPWPARVACFVAPESGLVGLWLRRYVKDHGSGWTCADGWHTAAVDIGEEPERREMSDGHRITANSHAPAEYAGDPRWPAECEMGCGYRFAEADAWQVFIECLYRMPDGSLIARRHLPPGALYDSWWYPETWKRNGEALTVVLPDGTSWNMDGPATGGGLWTRSGTPPMVTVTPSIFSSPPDGYHGFLTAGVLVRV